MHARTLTFFFCSADMKSCFRATHDKNLEWSKSTLVKPVERFGMMRSSQKSALTQPRAKVKGDPEAYLSKVPVIHALLYADDTNETMRTLFIFVLLVLSVAPQNLGAPHKHADDSHGDRAQ